jgi:hypothetical protein
MDAAALLAARSAGGQAASTRPSVQFGKAAPELERIGAAWHGWGRVFMLAQPDPLHRPEVRAVADSIAAIFQPHG